METMKKLGSTADLSNQPIHAIAEAAMRWTEFLNFFTCECRNFTGSVLTTDIAV